MGALAAVPGSDSFLELPRMIADPPRFLSERYRDVTAVEPLENMRAMLERSVPGVIALAGSAERIPLDDGSVEGVFAAQAFHWFDKAVALPEIARVLRSGGVLAVIWNGPDEGRADPFPAAYRAELEQLREAAEMPWEAEPEWEELLERSGLFAEVHARTEADAA